MRREITFVVLGRLDQLTGGYLFDRHIVDGLRARSRPVRVIELAHRTAAGALGGAFHARRLTLRSSQVGAVPADRQRRWSHRRRLALSLSLLRDPVFDILLSGESDFTALPELMACLAAAPAGVLCHTLRYD